MAKLTQSTLDRIAELREANATYDVIGSEVGLSPGYVSWLCLKHGFEPSNPTGWTAWETVRGPVVMKRGDHVMRRFTPEEDQRLLALEAEGLTYNAIARQLGRSRNSIQNRLMTLARRQARKEVA